MSVQHRRRVALGQISRMGWVLLMLLGLGLVVVLFFIKTRALEARAEVRQLEHVLVQTQAAVKMLEVEIAHLENPTRIRTLSETHLDLKPVEAQRVLTLEEAVRVLAKEKEAASKAEEDGQ